VTGLTYAGVDGLRVRLSENGVLRLELDRPEKRNALTDEMVAGLIEAIEAGGRDEAVRTILVSARGEHFCAGFDIVGRNVSPSPGDRRPRVGSVQRRLPSEAHRLIPLVATVQTPVVCAARGWVAGIGLHLVVAADFTVASDDVQVWEPFAERGFTPDSGGTWLLPRRVGEVRARELLLLGRRLDGAEAMQWGLVHRLVPDGDLEAETEALVAKLAAAPTVSLGLTKWLMHAGAGAPLDAHLRNEAFALELSSRSEDFREGLAAFRERREPHFKGR
jgi:2-(1,2-epoxy-1,2-dihydrophenyl)acetyl-CoA isomerase